MENRMLEARILQGQGYTQNQIAEILRVTDRTVRRYLSTAPRPRKTPVRQSKLDPFYSTIVISIVFVTIRIFATTGVPLNRFPSSST